jgi:CheY-like chemotaxis protein
MILCIDDEPTGLGVRKLLLESCGYKVMIATSGREGLEVFAANPVECVVLDYLMPEMNGGEVAAVMKRIKADVPILLLSAYVDLPDSALEFVDARAHKADPPADFIALIKRLFADSGR